MSELQAALTPPGGHPMRFELTQTRIDQTAKRTIGDCLFRRYWLLLSSVSYVVETTLHIPSHLGIVGGLDALTGDTE